VLKKPKPALAGPFAAPAEEKQKGEAAANLAAAPVEEQKKKDEMEKRAQKAALEAVYPVPVPVPALPEPPDILGPMIAKTEAGINREMNSRREIADDLREQEHERAIVAAKLQNAKELKAMEIEAMLKRLRMESDERRGIKRFGQDE